MTTGLMRQKKESLRGHPQWFEALLQSGTLPAPYRYPNYILSADLLDYAKTFRGLEYATEDSIATFLYDEMGFIPKPTPQGDRFRISKGGARGWVFPPIPDLRSRWERLHGGEWNWHDPELEWLMTYRS